MVKSECKRNSGKNRAGEEKRKWPGQTASEKNLKLKKNRNPRG